MHWIPREGPIERVSVKNALNPLLWVCGLVSFPAVVALALSSNASWVLVAVATVPVVVTLVAYLFFMVRDPDRLQSESFQLRKQALDLIEEKGELAIIDAETIEVISNPDLPALASAAALPGASREGSQ